MASSSGKPLCVELFAGLHGCYGKPGYKPQGFNVTNAQRLREGRKQEGSGPVWFDTGIAKHSSRSDSRKAASAQIAKIPFPLARWIAHVYKPL